MENDKKTVQQKIKRMIQLRRKTATQEEFQADRRMKSNAGDRHREEEGEEIVKPQSSLRNRRPTSAIRQTESVKVIPAVESSARDVDLRPVIDSVLDHSPKFRDFLRDNKMEVEEVRQKLMGNELFLLSTLNKLKGEPQQQHTAIIEKQMTSKLQRLLQIERQSRRCEQAEQRISQFIDQRLKALSQF